MEMEQKGLNREAQPQKGVLDIITSFVYKRDKPFNPDRLYKILNEAFMLQIMLPQDDYEEEGEAEQDEEDHENHEHDENGECVEDPEYLAELAAAKEKYK